MIDGGLNAYGKRLRVIYGAEPATGPAETAPASLRPPQPSQALRAEAWNRFADTALRIAAGRASWQERLVGNAFPPLWAEVIARHVGQQLGESLALSDF